ncbi:MAG: hypothetical protein ACPLRW_11590 [Moorellales bacterium]
MFPFDFTGLASGLQATLNQIVYLGFALVFKLFLLGLVIALACALVPRYLRPLMAVCVIMLVMCFGPQANAVGDWAAARVFEAAGIGEQASSGPSLADAGVDLGLGGLAGQVQGQVESAVNNYVEWVMSQFGL